MLGWPSKCRSVDVGAEILRRLPRIVDGLARCDIQIPLYGEAIAAFQRAGVLTGNSPEILGLLGYSYGMAGMKREAQDVLKELDNLSAQNSMSRPFSQTTIYIGLGETDLAFKWLKQARLPRATLVIGVARG